MAHWRTMVQSEYFCAADLWNDQLDKYENKIFRITKVAQGEVKGEKGRKKGLPFLTIEGVDGKPTRAPFGANPTNCTAIATALGTPDAKKWVGQWIGMYVTKVDSPKGLVDAIRIHPQRVPPPGQKGDQKAADPKPPGADGLTLSEADKRAIELAEQEEARRGR